MKTKTQGGLPAKSGEVEAALQKGSEGVEGGLLKPPLQQVWMFLTVFVFSFVFLIVFVFVFVFVFCIFFCILICICICI